ncbi:hypothetical protein EYE40_14865 [Glaciihabitans arcticus]|uniref:Type IV toxin-antitoxin system AbiEi family antitoxin domain-containing protein n=1 Tax=Glaciihabitans arcticus TaxID=2668039 RepID=A0A4Q9GPH6_9MICO|nr:hypothetical protein [Glaciihabitans arcticus]TBN55481.1 hypothetical protein EYE40_14865 [Glaciihabitans arcticus]
MQQLIDIAASRGDGLIFAAHLAELGLNGRDVRRALAEGSIVRVMRGIYAKPPNDRPFWPRELHALRTRGAAALEPRDAVVSHLSAAALHGLPLIGPWPDRVHLTVIGAAGGSSSAGIARHTARVASNETAIHGVRVTTLARTLVDVAATTSMLVGVTMMDAAIHRGDITRADLYAELTRARLQAGRRRGRACVDFSDGRSASPGESLTRVRAWELGFELPRLQVPVRTRLGDFEIDFGWESCALFGEFDGKVKYTRDAYLKGRSIEEVVMAEKAREDAIRAETGRGFVRIVWQEALRPVTLDALLRSAGVPRARRPVTSRPPG